MPYLNPASITAGGSTSSATFVHQIGETGAKALFDGRTSAQLLSKGFIALGGQVIDATLCR